MKITGLKKAIGDYKWAMSQGAYSGWSASLMLDISDGSIWADTFYGNEWKQYHSETIVFLGNMMDRRNIKINMANVKKFVEENF